MVAKIKQKKFVIKSKKHFVQKLGLEVEHVLQNFVVE